MPRGSAGRSDASTRRDCASFRTAAWDSLVRHAGARLDAARFKEGFQDRVWNTFALTDGRYVRGSRDRCRGPGLGTWLVLGPRPTAWC